MAVYRYQVVSVGMWRGKVKRWNTTFHAATSSGTTAVKNMMQALCWPNPGDVAGACSGGLASITIYAATGGAPISQTVYFDWQTPSTWIPFTGAGWSGIDPTTPLDASGESALIAEALRPGLSSTGKPVYVRKYIHAVPSRTAADYSDPDIPAGTVSTLSSAMNGIYFCTPSGVQATSPTAYEWYGNHQRVRGRRRTTNQVAAQSFSAGVAAGAAAGSAGAASPQ